MVDLEEILKCIEEKREQLYKAFIRDKQLGSLTVLRVSSELDTLLNEYHRICAEGAKLKNRQGSYN